MNLSRGRFGIVGISIEFDGEDSVVLFNIALNCVQSYSTTRDIRHLVASREPREKYQLGDLIICKRVCLAAQSLRLGFFSDLCQINSATIIKELDANLPMVKA